jgi:hypothetical protein
MKEEEEIPWQGLPSGEPESDFAWKSCARKHARIRVALKQQAVNDAFTYAHEIRDLLQEAFDGIDPGHATAFDLMGGNEIRAWIEDMGEYLVWVQLLRSCSHVDSRGGTR